MISKLLFLLGMKDNPDKVFNSSTLQTGINSRNNFAESLIKVFDSLGL